MGHRLSVDVDLMSIPDAAEELGMNYGSVLWHIGKGRIRSVRLGKHATMVYGADVYRLKAQRERRRVEELVAG